MQTTQSLVWFCQSQISFGCCRQMPQIRFKSAFHQQSPIAMSELFKDTIRGASKHVAISQLDIARYLDKAVETTANESEGQGEGGKGTCRCPLNLLNAFMQSNHVWEN